MRTSRFAAWALLGVLPLAGCTPGSATNSPTPAASASPTYLCTPEMGGAPAPCSPEEYTEMQRLDLLYAEAERSYRRFHAEYSKLYRAGGAEKATPTLAAVAGGKYLEAQVLTLRRLQELQVKAVGGDFALVRLGRSPGASARGYDIALDACIDGRSVPLVQGDKEVGRGIAYQEVVYFKREGGVLKLWDAEGKQVEGC